jgi:hypothetical protein
MSRSLRALVAIVVVSFAVSAAACANTAGPRAMQCDTNSANVCH